MSVACGPCSCQVAQTHAAPAAQVHRLAIMAAEAGLLCPARLLAERLGRADDEGTLGLLRNLHPQLHLPTLQASNLSCAADEAAGTCKA